MAPDIIPDKEPRLFAALRRRDGNAVLGEGAINDVGVKLRFDEDGAYLSPIARLVAGLASADRSRA